MNSIKLVNCTGEQIAFNLSRRNFSSSRVYALSLYFSSEYFTLMKVCIFFLALIHYVISYVIQIFSDEKFIMYCLFVIAILQVNSQFICQDYVVQYFFEIQLEITVCYQMDSYHSYQKLMQIFIHAYVFEKIYIYF